MAGFGHVVWNASDLKSTVEQQGARTEKVGGRLDAIITAVMKRGQRLDRIERRLEAMGKQLEALLGRGTTG